MAHYADGTPAKIGDLVVNKASWNKAETVLVVIGIQASSDTCNANGIVLAQKSDGSPAWFPMGPQGAWTVTLKECMRLDTPEFPLPAVAQSTAG